MQYLKLNKLVFIEASTGGLGQIKKSIQSLAILKNSSVLIAQLTSESYK